MKKLNTIKDFQELRSRLVSSIKPDIPTIVVCAGTACQASGANDLIRVIKREFLRLNLSEKVNLRITGCHGFCEMGPFILTEPQQAFYPQVKLEDVPRIISALLSDKYVEELLYQNPNTGERYFNRDEIPFFKNQQRSILGLNQKIDPIRIYDYITQKGYLAFEQVLSKQDTEWVVKQVKSSQLRGRGGAGFPTGLKWEMLSKQPGKKGKYIVCNADEGDPGAYMDRSVLEGNPHSIIEGMLIGAYGTGATEGMVYVRNEYPIAVKHLIIAIRQARDLGLLGENILGSDFSFDIKIVKGAGAFVCGEETALMRSIEGKKGEPRQRPPYPVEKGINGKPTAINNVETWANIPLIFRLGAKEFAKIGTKGNSGTKIFSLVGKIKNTGLVEVPMGITINEVVYDIGGGPSGRSKIKAVQTGGPSGGCIPTSLFDLKIDFESLAAAGSIMGSGGMIVMDENSCMVDVAKYFMNFLKDESCGKCFTCRKGTQRMFEILEDISNGKGTLAHLDLLEELANVVKDTTMCGLGQTAANPVLATIRHFKEEFLEHIEKKRCRAAVCNEIISSPCQHTCPIDTEAPNYIALIAAGKYKEALKIIKKDNPLSSTLARVCHHPCEKKCRAGEGGEAIAIRNLKRFVTDYGLKNKLMPKAQVVPENGKGKVAIVGSGPAGLSCAFELRQMGYGVTIFEKLPVLGGMLAVAIPEYRLPKNILKADIDYIISSGIEVKTDSALGKDFTLDDLFKKGYKAIFIATGAHKSLKLGIQGEDIQGVYPSMEVLTAINLGKKISIGKKVGIVGGGNSAVDAARAVLRTGIPESVTVFYRRTIAEMPALKDEIDAAIEEGIEIQFLTAPTKAIEKNGKLNACEFIKMKLGGYDSSGRRKPVPVKGSEFVVKLDTLIAAISEKPDISFAENMKLATTKWNTLEVNTETFATALKGVFAGGDVTTGPNTVVDAVSNGKKAAKSISQFIRGEKIFAEYKLTRPSSYFPPAELSDEELEELLKLGRSQMPSISPQKRKHFFKEVELGFTDENAIKEAKRCLRCELETGDGKNFLEKLKERAK